MLTALEVHYQYVKNLLEGYSSDLMDYVNTPIAKDEPTPYELMMHRLEPLYSFSFKKYHKISEEETIQLPPADHLKSISAAMKFYKETIEIGKKARTSFHETDLDKIRNFAIAGMHAIHHIGQAVRFITVKTIHNKLENNSA